MNSPLRYAIMNLYIVSFSNSLVSNGRNDIVLNFRSLEIVCKKGSQFACIISTNK